jgi:hypothetical protein
VATLPWIGIVEAPVHEWSGDVQWTDIGRIGIGAVGSFIGVVPGLLSGIAGLQLPSDANASVAPVMRPLNPAETGLPLPTIGLDVDGGKSEAGPPVMEALDGSGEGTGILAIDLLHSAEKPVAYDDVMPALTPEDIAQVQLIDEQAADFGQLLNEISSTDLGAGEFDGDGVRVLSGVSLEVLMPSPDWVSNGMLHLTDADNPLVIHPQMMEVIGVSGAALDTMQPDESGIQALLGDTAEGWA